MKSISCIICLLIGYTSLSQDDTIKSFIPKNYDTLQVAKGDLNGDDKDDLALALYNVIEKTSAPDDDNLPPRILMIFFNTDNGYIKSISSSSALMCKNCGGIFGDPFNGLTIQNKVLSVAHYGGSSDRWSEKDKFRYQDNNWYLIGKTTYSYSDLQKCDKLNDYVSADYKDVNYITGEYEEKKISEDCKLLVNKKGRQAVNSLTLLSKFNIDN